MKIHIHEKRFGDKILFSSFRLFLDRGDSLLVTGESGRGKTTLLRILASLDSDYDGSRPDEKAVMLFQEDRLVENLSVISNLRLVTNDRNAAVKMLSAMGLEKEENSRVSTLSGGMKRRLSLSRLLLLDSPVYLLDEPFTGLDEETKKRCASVVRNVTADRILVVVSHSAEDGKMLGCNRLLRL